MKKGSSPARSCSSVFLLFAIFLCAALTLSCASTGGEVKKEVRWQANELCKGIKAYAHGYTQFHKVVIEMEMGNPEKAEKHLEKALKHFDKAIVHFQNAEGTREEAELNQRIAKALAKGNEELRKADDCFDKGEQGKAGIHCGAAVRDFAEAMEMMEPTE